MATVRYILTADASGLESVIEDVRTNFDNAGTSANNLQLEIDRLAVEIEQAGGVTGVTNDTINELANIASSAGISSSDLTNELSGLGLTSDQLDSVLNQLNTTTQTFNTETGQTEISLGSMGNTLNEVTLDVSSLYNESEQLVISQQTLSGVNNELSSNLSSTTDELNRQSQAKGQNSENTRDYTQATGMAVGENGRLIPILQQSNTQFNRKNGLLRATTVATGAAATATGAFSGASSTATGALLGQASAGLSSASSLKDVVKRMNELKIVSNTSTTALASKIQVDLEAVKTQRQLDESLSNFKTTNLDFRDTLERTGIVQKTQDRLTRAIVTAQLAATKSTGQFKGALAILSMELERLSVSMRQEKEANGEFSDEAIKSVEDQGRALQTSLAAWGDLNEQKRSLNSALDELNNTINQNEAAVKSVSDQVDKATASTTDNTDANRTNNESQGQGAQKSNLWARSLENLSEKLNNSKAASGEYGTTVQKVTNALSAKAKKTSKASKENAKLNEQLKKNSKNANGAEESFGALDGVLGMLPDSLMAIVRGAKATTVALTGIFVANPTIALIAATIGLIAWSIKDLQPVIDTFANIWIDLSTRVEIFRGHMQELITSFGLAGEQVVGFHGNVENMAQALKDVRVEIRSLERDLNLDTALLNKELQANLVVYRDINNSLEDRVNALDRTGVIQDQILDKEEEVLVAKIRQMALSNQLNDTNEAAQKEYNDLVAELIQLQARRERQDFQRIRRQNRLTRELRQQKEETENLINEINRANEEAHLARLREFDEQKTALQEAFWAGLVAIDDYLEAYENLQANIQRFNEERRAADEEARQAELDALQNRLNNVEDSFKTEKELALQNIQDTFDEREAIIDKALENNLITEEEHLNLLSNLRTQKAQEEADLRREETEETETLKLNTIAGVEAKIARLREKYRNAESDAEREGLLEAISAHEKDLANFKMTEEEKERIRQEAHERQKERMQEEGLMILQGAIDIQRAWSNMQQSFAAARIQDIQRATESELKAAEKRGASEEEIQKIRERGRKKEAQAKTEAARKEKRWALAQAAMETAISIIEAAPNLFKMGVALAVGGAQTAAIAAQPIPVFRDGGFVSGAGNGRSDSIPARLSNGEFVINADSTRRNRELLEQINNTGQATPQTQNVNVTLDLDDVIDKIDTRSEIRQRTTLITK